MVERMTTARLIDLLHAQRRAAEQRAGQRRDSEAWLVASRQLDDLNDQIMHLGALGATAAEAPDEADQG